MDKASVIALRDSLLQNGENRSVRIAFDNGVILSQASDTIIWDDAKELVIAFTTDSDSGAYSAQLPIRVITSTYEHIQFIMGNTNVDKLPEVIDSLGSVVNITEDTKNKLVEWYTKVFSHEYELSRKNYDPVDIKRD